METVKINYFGTDLSSAGHYIWEIDESGNGLINRSLNFNSIPFNPERMTDPEYGYYLTKGSVRWHRFNGFTVCGIEGSCKDNRQGSHSVFWVTEDVTNEALKERILSTPVCKKIIEQMPFEVQW